ncbi:unnamed protein product, partial [Prorocentrum cordatum]
RPNRWARRAVCARPPPREALRAKLLVISRGLTRLAGPGGSLAGTDVGPDIAEFNARIEAVVRSTAGRRDAGALSQLAEVMDSVASLAKDISGHQMQLMQEGEGHQDSLLLGVLMAKKGEPMARQLEVLSAPAFARLRVTQAVLARKDTTTPLFQQDGQSLRILRSAQEKEDRRFQRRMDIQRRDIGTMTAAIDAMEHGDVQGVERAEAALESSVRKMRSQGSGFLVLIQEGLRASGLDCPYCAAQCVDACHAAGSPYVACLAECQGVGT